MLLRLDPRDRLDGQVQHLDQRLVLGPADDAAVSRRRADPRGVMKQVGQAAGTRHRVGVGIVVREHQGAPVLAGHRKQLAQPIAEGELIDVVDCPLL